MGMGNRQQRVGGNYRVILTFLIDIVYICFVVLLCCCYLLSIIEKYSVFYFGACLSS